MNLKKYLKEQFEFSEKTFGPPNGSSGVIDHIKQEIVEIEDDPQDIYEWIDIVILAFDGAYREGFTPEQIADALQAKFNKNKTRKWPDWRTVEPGKAINHIKEN